MKRYNLDTNIISYLLKGDQDLFLKINKEITGENEIFINAVTYYEIYRGLLFVDNHSKLKIFKEMCNIFGILELNKDILEKAAKIYADLRKKGKLIEDADIFIGAISIWYNSILITNNEKHFKRIEGLKIENWSK